jgi:hypothetical protein
VGVLISLAAVVTTYMMGRKSLVKGILTALSFGYFFGIVRANFPETASYFIFDGAVIGLYAAQFKQITRPFLTRDGQRLKHWVVFLILWPVLLFFAPQQDYLVQLVGLRGNMFLLPFVLIGSHLHDEEVYDLALWLAVLNIAAFGIGTAEYLFGIEHFFPQNQLTYLIYRSNDVGAAGAYRIPSIFSNAHSFGGMMAISIPWITGAWVQQHRKVWQKNLLAAGIVVAIIGIFMSAARIDFLVLVVLVTVFTFSARVRPIYRVAWLVILVLIGYVVATNERMQRFKTLNDPEFVATRVGSSVNVDLLEAVVEYPFGLGLGGGGTSVPYFLESRVNRPIAIESEFGRIHLETGIVGLIAWVGFLIFAFTRHRPHLQDPWFLGIRLAWFCNFTFLMIGLIGIGLMTAIPCSAVLLMSLGWVANRQEQVLQGSITPSPIRLFEPRPKMMFRPGVTRT